MTTILQCENVSKFYGAKQALKDVSFSCEAGEPIALVGPNGAGKTTLFSLCCNYQQPSSGSVGLLGMEPGSKGLVGKIAALPQDAQFDPEFTILRQLTLYAELQGFGRQQAKTESLRVLELMDLSDSVNEKPNVLSHGMRKRAAIAQSLIGNPELVFLDEPTAGIDPANARNIRQQISAISHETTFIISSHNLQELEKLCKTVLYIKNGSLQQQTDIANTATNNFITLQIDSVGDSEFIGEVKKIVAVSSVSNKQKNEYVIHYDQVESPDLDQQLLRCLADRGWNYKSLMKGRTLEEQLFSD